MVRGFGAMVLAAALLASQTAFAADDAPATAPLAPGPAAGIRGAQTAKQLDGIAIAAGVGLAVLAIYLIKGTHYHVHGSGDVPKQGSTSGTK